MKKSVLNVLIGLNLALIWGNSLMNAQASNNVSGGVLAFLGSFLPFLLTEAGHTFLRKAAHFSEFALLGLLTSGRSGLNAKPVSPGLMGFGLAVACIDETIQIFTPGRASSLLDVWIDAAGFALGFVVIFVYHTFQIKGERTK